MSRRMRAYYYAVLGAMGGLVAWQISNLLGLSFAGSIYLSDAVVGALIGTSVGLLIGTTEGVVMLNPARAARAGGVSALLGLVAGAVGLPLGEWLFQAVGAGTLGRALGWGLFGLLIGLAEGVTGGTQIWKGALGGLLGGLLGGFLLEGASVGAFIALIVVLLSRAWLQVTSGKLKGMEFILDKFMKPNGPSAFIGSDVLKSDIVLTDPGIAPQHAMLSGAGTHFILKDMSTSGTFINNHKIEQARRANQQTIRMGSTELVYHEKR
jgi:hypothetical protein